MSGPGNRLHSPSAPVTVQKCYDLVLDLMQRIEKFPRSQRFTIGDRLAEAALDVLEDLSVAAYSREKRRLLERANLRLHRLRILTRLAKDLRGPHPAQLVAPKINRAPGRLVAGRWRALPRGAFLAYPTLWSDSK